MPGRDGGEIKVKTILIGNFGIGRKRSKKNAQRLAMYINGDVHKLNLRESREFTFRGAITIIIALFSLLLCAVFGQFDDSKKTRMMGPGSKTIDEAKGRW